MLIRHLPRDAPLWREVHGDDMQWGLNEQLLAVIADYLALSLWQQAGDKKAKKPTPLPRPGVTRAIGAGKGRTLAEVDKFLDRFRPKKT